MSLRKLLQAAALSAGLAVAAFWIFEGGAPTVFAGLAATATPTPVQIVRTATPTFTATAQATNTALPTNTSVATPVPATPVPATATSPAGGAGGAVVAPNTGAGNSSGNDVPVWLIGLGAVLAAAGGGSMLYGMRRRD